MSDKPRDPTRWNPNTQAFEGINAREPNDYIAPSKPWFEQGAQPTPEREQASSTKKDPAKDPGSMRDLIGQERLPTLTEFREVFGTAQRAAEAELKIGPTVPAWSPPAAVTNAFSNEVAQAVAAAPPVFPTPAPHLPTGPDVSEFDRYLTELRERAHEAREQEAHAFDLLLSNYAYMRASLAKETEAGEARNQGHKATLTELAAVTRARDEVMSELTALRVDLQHGDASYELACRDRADLEAKLAALQTKYDVALADLETSRTHAQDASNVRHHAVAERNRAVWSSDEALAHARVAIEARDEALKARNEMLATCRAAIAERDAASSNAAEWRILVDKVGADLDDVRAAWLAALKERNDAKARRNEALKELAALKAGVVVIDDPMPLPRCELASQSIDKAVRALSGSGGSFTDYEAACVRQLDGLFVTALALLQVVALADARAAGEQAGQVSK